MAARCCGAYCIIWSIYRLWMTSLPSEARRLQLLAALSGWIGWYGCVHASEYPLVGRRRHFSTASARSDLIDVECKNCEVCGSGQIETSACTPTHNTVCEDKCGAGHGLDSNGVCQPCTAGQHSENNRFENVSDTAVLLEDTRASSFCLSVFLQPIT